MVMADGDKRCSCGRGHETFGACMRAKNIRLSDVGGTGITRAWDASQQGYYDARKAGIQPASPLKKDVDHAVRISDKYGEAYRG